MLADPGAVVWDWPIEMFGIDIRVDSANPARQQLSDIFPNCTDRLMLYSRVFIRRSSVPVYVEAIREVASLRLGLCHSCCKYLVLTWRLLHRKTTLIQAYS